MANAPFPSEFRQHPEERQPPSQTDPPPTTWLGLTPTPAAPSCPCPTGPQPEWTHIPLGWHRPDGPLGRWACGEGSQRGYEVAGSPQVALRRGTAGRLCRAGGDRRTSPSVVSCDSSGPGWTATTSSGGRSCHPRSKEATAFPAGGCHGAEPLPWSATRGSAFLSGQCVSVP